MFRSSGHFWILSLCAQIEWQSCSSKLPGCWKFLYVFLKVCTIFRLFLDFSNSGCVLENIQFRLNSLTVSIMRCLNSISYVSICFIYRWITFIEFVLIFLGNICIININMFSLLMLSCSIFSGQSSSGDSMKVFRTCFIEGLGFLWVLLLCFS